MPKNDVPQEEEERFVSSKEVQRRWSVSKSHLRRMIVSQVLPPPLVLGPGTLRWRLSVIRQAEAKFRQGKGVTPGPAVAALKKQRTEARP